MSNNIINITDNNSNIVINGEENNIRNYEDVKRLLGEWFVMDEQDGRLFRVPSAYVHPAFVLKQDYRLISVEELLEVSDVFVDVDSGDIFSLETGEAEFTLQVRTCGYDVPVIFYKAGNDDFWKDTISNASGHRVFGLMLPFDVQNDIIINAPTRYAVGTLSFRVRKMTNGQYELSNYDPHTNRETTFIVDLVYRPNEDRLGNRLDENEDVVEEADDDVYVPPPTK